jgi:hypothetical protein
VPNGTFTVTNLSGDPNGMGSLPNEVAAANAAAGTNTVVFQHGLSGQVDLTKTLNVGTPTSSVTIEGAGAQIQITGVTAGILLQTRGTVHLDDLTITGAGDSGVFNPAGTNNLTITNSTLSLNSTNNFGGGIDNRAVLLMVNDTVAFNHANKDGGISRGAGVTIGAVQSSQPGGGASNGGGGQGSTSPTLLKPFLLALLDEFFHGVETVNSNGTETVTKPPKGGARRPRKVPFRA